MDALTSLLAAVIGGVLVLAGDLSLRRAENRRDERQRLADAAIEMSVVIHRMAGVLDDARGQGKKLTDVHYMDPRRHELSSRFWALPGSHDLLPPGSQLAQSWRILAAAYNGDDDRWQEAKDTHHAALSGFETRISTFLESNLRRPKPITPGTQIV